MDSSSSHSNWAILAIETSLRNASVCVSTPSGGSEESLPLNLPTTQTLAPMVARLLQRSGCRVNELSCVAVDCGPGSFTGLRLGLAFAKTLCFAAQIPVVGVHSLEVLAHQSTPMEDGQSRKVLAVLDARRKQFFAAGYLVDRTAQREQIAPRLVNEAWLAQMAERGWALVGPVIGQFMQSGFLAKITDTSAVPAIHSQALPSAGSLAEIATQRLADGQLDDLWTLKPLYLRPSAAEEKLPPLDPFKVSP